MVVDVVGGRRYWQREMRSVNQTQPCPFQSWLSLRKSQPDGSNSINQTLVYINQALNYINQTLNYINQTLVYRLSLKKQTFSATELTLGEGRRLFGNAAGAPVDEQVIQRKKWLNERFSRPKTHSSREALACFKRL